MKKILLLDIKRGIFNLGWLFSVVISLVILYRPLRGCFSNIGVMHVLELITLPMALSGFTVFAAAFPVMGYSRAFFDDFSTGYANYILGRMSWKKYGIMRLTSVGISGGLSLAVPFSAIFAICYIAGDKGPLNGRLYEGSHIEVFIERYGIMGVLGAKLILGFLFGALWALTALCISLFILNKYVALLGPFVLYQFMWITLFNYPLLNPIFLMRGDDLDSYLLSGIMLFAYIFFVSAVIMYALNRRIKNG